VVGALVRCLLCSIVVSLNVFGPFWGDMLDQFGNPKSIQKNTTYEFSCFVDIVNACSQLLRSGRSYGGPISVLCSHRFLHPFLLDSGVDLGVHL